MIAFSVKLLNAHLMLNYLQYDRGFSVEFILAISGVNAIVHLDNKNAFIVEFIFKLTISAFNDNLDNRCAINAFNVNLY